MKLSRLKTFASFFLAGGLAVPAWAAKTGQPGSLNYVEGQVAIDQQTVDPQSIGSTMLQPGQLLTTGNGKAEILLTPGVFLRVDDESSIQMVSAGLTNTTLTLEQGRAMVDVTEIHPENNLRITEDGVTTQLVKTGIYDFDAAQNQIRVFNGKAVVFDGDREVTIDGGHQVDLNLQGKLKAEKFDKQSYEQSDRYRWSSLRSSYLAEANVDAARVYVSNGYYGPGWVGAGWYWDPWYGAYTFIPANGIFYSPFGWGFYSPLVVFRSPVFFVGRPFFHHFGPTFRTPVIVGRPGVVGGFRPAPVLHPAPGFHPAPVMRPGMVQGPTHGFAGGAGVMHGGGGFHGGGGGSRPNGRR